jgi:ABC-type transport system involved in multi-copper enzyme maturation permease subunit
VSETTVNTGKKSKTPSPPDRWFNSNPLVLKELRSRMRGRRAFITLTGYVAIISAAVGVIYAIFLSSNSPINNVNEQQTFGKVLFGGVVWLELLSVCFMAPALTAGGISSEREHQTYDILRTTLLSPRALVMGKFLSGLMFLLLLLLCALPLQSLAFLFGGVALEEFLIAIVILVVTAITFCAVGIFFSSFASRTLISTVLSYGFAILLVFGLPMVIIVGLSASSALFSGFSSPNFTTFQQVMLVILGWIVIASNPLATAIATEVILLEEQSAFLFILPLNNGYTLPLPSPWIPYIILYLLLSFVLLLISTRMVRRSEK